MSPAETDDALLYRPITPPPPPSILLQVGARGRAGDMCGVQQGRAPCGGLRCPEPHRLPCERAAAASSPRVIAPSPPAALPPPARSRTCVIPAGPAAAQRDRVPPGASSLGAQGPPHPPPLPRFPAVPGTWPAFRHENLSAAHAHCIRRWLAAPALLTPCAATLSAASWPGRLAGEAKRPARLVAGPPAGDCAQEGLHLLPRPLQNERSPPSSL